MITVTKTFLPPQEEYNAILSKAWETGWLTNRGELVLSLEDQLKAFLNLNNLLLTNNGTIPIQIALKVLCKKKEVITTPFSYVATASSIVWENFTPVFIDIDETYLTIDESKIENAITENTGAILATHVFGNPCNVLALQEIGEKYKLPIIYDGAHSFGVKYMGESIFQYGTASTCSFHATKLFHTGEGGAIVSNDKNLQEQFFHAHNFGHDGPLAFHGLGVNGKMSELNAAMGLAVLTHIDFIIEERKKIVQLYNENIDFSKVKGINIRPNTDWNYSYYPILFEDESSLLKTQMALNKQDIYPRRYFYPALNTLPYVNSAAMPIAESISKRVMCLPLFVGLAKEEVLKICNLIASSLQ